MKTYLLHLAAIATISVALSSCSGDSVATPASPFASPQPANPTASTQSYVQFELLSRPAVKEVFETFNNHKVTNAAEPYADPTLQTSITNFTNAFRGAAYGTALTSILYPNEMSADLSQTGSAAYLGVETGGATGGKFGGRGLTDNVIDISLGAIFGKTLTALGVVATDDGKSNTCLASENVAQKASQAGSSTFPYLSDPH